MTILTGVLYPLLVTVIGQTVFADKANGSLIVINDKTIGSELIGQKFIGNQYFHSRPSAIDYNPMPSCGSNLSITSKTLQDKANANSASFDSINELAYNQSIPSEMVYASGSGLDPHISPQAALLQVNRISKSRNLTATAKLQLNNLITKNTESRQLGILGEERVNVLKLNLELDKQFEVR